MRRDRACLLGLAGVLLLGARSAGGDGLEVKRLEDGVPMLSYSAPATPRQASGPGPDASVERLIQYHSQRQGLDPRLVRAVIEVESAFDPRARSRKGAIGLMQLMPETARELGVEDIWDPAENVRGGTTYLRQMLDRFEGDTELALAGYNAGPTVVERYGRIPPFRETRNYVRKVLQLFRSVGGAPAPRRPSGRPVLARRDAEGGLVLFTPD